MAYILLNNILKQRGLISHEKSEDLKTVHTAKDEIMVGTERLQSDEWREQRPERGCEAEAGPRVAPKRLEMPGGWWLLM